MSGAKDNTATDETPLTWKEFERVCLVVGTVLRVEPLGAVTTYQYQANGLLARVLAPGVPEARFEYDTQGRLVVEAQGGQRVEYGYDPAGSLVRIRHGDGAEERLAYHPDARLRSVAQARGWQILDLFS